MLISRLVPFHILTVIRNEKRQVDVFEDLTLIFTDLTGIAEMGKNYLDPRETVGLLAKVFTRFDQLCEEYRVYKVHTIGNQYVAMGYNGKTEKNRRFKGVVVDETYRMIQTGLEMIDIIKEIRESYNDPQYANLDVRVGIHTGKVVAGIIGSKIVRYDILGEGVLITNKI